MAENAYYTLLDRQNVGVSQNGDIVDLGAHNVLQIMFMRHTVGTAGVLKLQHSASTDAATFQDMDSFQLNASGSSFVTRTSFLRYVRWVTDAAVAGGPPIVSLWIVGKSG